MSPNILDPVDYAMTDWSVSSDAMRSQPPEALPRRDDMSAFVAAVNASSPAVMEAKRQYLEAVQRLDESLARTPSPLDVLIRELRSRTDSTQGPR